MKKDTNNMAPEKVIMAGNFQAIGEKDWKDRRSEEGCDTEIFSR